jgi:hypothetical protein
MRVVCTGSVGSDRMGYLQGVKELAVRAGIDLELFNVGDMMLQKADDMGRLVSREVPSSRR